MGILLPREAHLERQVQLKNMLQKHGCHVKLEKTIDIENAKVIVDVYVKSEGKTFLIEIGNIDDNRKTALMKIYAQQNPNIEFIHEGYGEDKSQQVLSSLSSYRETQEYKDYLGKIENKKKKLELRQKKGLTILPKEVRERIQYPEETLQIVSPITHAGGLFKARQTDFWVITNQQLIFYSPKFSLCIKFEDFFKVDVIHKSGRRLKIGLRIGYQEDGKYAYKNFYLGTNPRNAKFILGFKRNIEKYYDLWAKSK